MTLKIGGSHHESRRAFWREPMNFCRVCAGAAALGALLAQPVHAEDTLKLTVGQRGNWATSVAEIGQRAGIFKKHGVALELLYTQGSGETQQAVIAGSVDIGIAPGTMGAMSAFAKGAPVRIIGAETTGASDLYWYVKADSPITSLKDFDGKTVAYSTNGALDTYGGFRLHEGARSQAQTDRDRRTDTHAYPSHVRPDRRGLGRSTRRA